MGSSTDMKKKEAAILATLQNIQAIDLSPLEKRKESFESSNR
jgi:hypothetical protein